MSVVNNGNNDTDILESECIYLVKLITHIYPPSSDFFYDRYIAWPRGHREEYGILAFRDKWGAYWVNTSALGTTERRIGNFSYRGMQGKTVYILGVIENGVRRQPTKEEEDGYLTLCSGDDLSFKSKTLRLREKLNGITLDDLEEKPKKGIQALVDDIMNIDLSKWS